MEAFEEEEEGEEGHETGAEVVTEDGEGQAGLGDGVPGALHQVLWGGPRNPIKPPKPHHSTTAPHLDGVEPLRVEINPTNPECGPKSVGFCPSELGNTFTIQNRD